MQKQNFKGLNMFKFLGIAISALLILGCSIKEQTNFKDGKMGGREYRFRILPVKVEETPDDWLFRDKFLETPFVSFTENNETIAGVLYMPHGSYKVQGEVNIVYENENIFGNFPIMDCETGKTEFDADIKLKPTIHTLFEDTCVKIEL